MSVKSVMSVLIAEHDRSTRNVHRFLLEIAGYQTVVAPDAPSALAVLRTHPVGMVALLDWDLPKIGCMRILRGLSHAPEVAVRHRFVVLASAPELLNSRLMTLPASICITFLRKPATNTELLIAVGMAAQAVPIPPADTSQAP